MEWNDIYQLFNDHPDLREVIIQGFQTCHLIFPDGRTSVPSPYKTSQEASDKIQELVLQLGERLDPRYPAHGGSIEGKYRWHALMAPIVTLGAVLSVRKQSIWQIEDFEDRHNLIPDIVNHLQKDNPLLICGLTGCGKTSFLVALLQKYFFNQRVVIIETLAELFSLSPHWICLHTSPPDYDGLRSLSVRDLFAQTLRILPDKIVFSELRIEEAPTFFESLYSGYAGTLATLHCTSSCHVQDRIQSLMGYTHAHSHLSRNKLAACYLKGGAIPKIESFQPIELQS